MESEKSLDGERMLRGRKMGSERERKREKKSLSQMQTTERKKKQSHMLNMLVHPVIHKVHPSGALILSL